VACHTGLSNDERTGLTVAEAKRMSDDELRTEFYAFAMDLVGSFGEDTLPASFPFEPGDMARDQILAALDEHKYWFDPEGKHPARDNGQARSRW
jgi:hypothetical protein